MYLVTLEKQLSKTRPHMGEAKSRQFHKPNNFELPYTRASLCDEPRAKKLPSSLDKQMHRAHWHGLLCTGSLSLPTKSQCVFYCPVNYTVASRATYNIPSSFDALQNASLFRVSLRESGINFCGKNGSDKKRVLKNAGRTRFELENAFCESHYVFMKFINFRIKFDLFVFWLWLSDKTV